MTINPIIPIWLMLIICAGLLLLKRRGALSYVRQIIAVVLIFVINLRPMVQSDNVTTNVNKLDVYVLFVVDDTISMLARDYDGDTERLEAVKNDCHKIIDGLDAAKFAFITFNNDASLVMPFSDDADYAASVLDTINPIDYMYASGSSMNVCRELMTNTLKRASDRGDGKIVVFFISDGENTNGDSLESFADAGKYIDGGAVMGYGTDEGGEMYVTSYYTDEEEVVKDTSKYPYGEPAVSKIDEDNLKQIAQDLTVDYVNMNRENADDLAAYVRDLADSTEETSVEHGYVDIYYIFAGLLMVMMVWELWLMRRNMGWLRK